MLQGRLGAVDGVWESMWFKVMLSNDESFVAGL